MSQSPSQLADALPLDLDRYPAQLREQAMSALTALAAQPPAAPQIAREEPPADSGQQRLPEQAPHLLTMCGFPQAGKDVVADLLVARYQGVARFAFSDGIIEEANRFLAPYGHQITPSNKSLPHNRLLLQVWGLGRRVEDPHYWTRQVANQVKGLQASGARLVLVSGARIPLNDQGQLNLNDLKLIWQLGGEAWLAHRPGNPYVAEHSVEAGLAQISLDSFDRVVLNAVEGSLEAYHDNIEAVLRRQPQPHQP